ncbi:transposase, partial [Candidatus Poribacteria bacterium]
AFSKFLSIVKQVARKCKKHVAFIDRWYPSTKTCHGCGYVNDAITLRDRTWRCPQCQRHHLRDLNAAINIIKVGASTHELGTIRQAIACNCCSS